MADLPTAYPLRDLYDAAVRSYSVKLTCLGCGHVCVFDGRALWWLFHRRGWKDNFPDVQRRCVCMVCSYHEGKKTRRLPTFELVHEPATDTRLPMPCEIDWKREQRRRR